MGWHPLRDRRNRRLEASAGLRWALRLIREDLTVLDEQVRQLRGQVCDAPDAAVKADYERARQAHLSVSSSCLSARSVSELEELRPVLDEARYYLACVIARRDGHAVPSRHDPCFFDARHGPAATDVLWAAPGGEHRRVGACSRDAASLAEGRQPDFRLVRVGDRWMPWCVLGGTLTTAAETHVQALRHTGTHVPRGHTAGASLDPLGPLS